MKDELAERRARKLPQSPRAHLRLVDGAIEFDHPGLDGVLVFTPELAEDVARHLQRLARAARRKRP